MLKQGKFWKSSKVKAKPEVMENLERSCMEIVVESPGIWNLKGVQTLFKDLHNETEPTAFP